MANRSVFAYTRALSPGGTSVVVGGATARIFQVLALGPVIARTSGKNVALLLHRPRTKDLEFMTGLFEAGKVVVVPMIHRRYPLSDVPAALRYFGEGHVKGKIVIAM